MVRRARAGDRDRGLSRRIDLIGEDELAEGEMKMVWVDVNPPRPGPMRTFT